MSTRYPAERVVIVQPHISWPAYQRLAEHRDDPEPSDDVLRLHLVENLLTGAALSVVGRGARLGCPMTPSTLRDFQVPYARPAAEVTGWSDSGAIGLAEGVNRARPTMLIGTSTEAGAFTEPIGLV